MNDYRLVFLACLTTVVEAAKIIKTQEIVSGLSL